MASFSFPTWTKRTIVEQSEDIAAEKGMHMSRIIMHYWRIYVKTHASGNPSFEIDKWIEKPEFIGDPALRESNDKWDRYLDSCDEKDLQELMGTFQKRLQQTNQSWKKKKGFTR